MTNLFEFIIGLINLALLAFLLWKLFGKAVKGALTEREQEIRSKVEEAEAMYSDAKAEFDKYQNLVNNLEDKQAELVERAQRLAAEHRASTAVKAKQEAEDIVSKVKSDMEDAHRLAKAQLRTEIAKATVLQAKAILTENIDESIHQNILEKFLSTVGGKRC
ncbi:MAG: ATP synthase F0 subunit B [bacterium]|nr:ATP synthase F0 subunit B [bacterium]